jgi:hypothetical protein
VPLHGRHVLESLECRPRALELVAYPVVDVGSWIVAFLDVRDSLHLTYAHLAWVALDVGA